MPDKNIEVVDDFILDMDIETITLDENEFKSEQVDSGISTIDQSNMSSDFGELTLEDSIQLDSIDTGNMAINDFNTNSNPEGISLSEGLAAPDLTTESASIEGEIPETLDLDISEGALDIIEETPEPAIPMAVAGIEEAQIPETPFPAEETPHKQKEALFNSSEDIITVHGSDLDQILYSSAAEEEKFVPEAMIDNVAVVDEPIPSSEDTMMTLELPEENESLIDTAVFDNKEIVPMPEETVTEIAPSAEMDIQTMDMTSVSETAAAQPPENESAEFSFDLSVIPDVAEIEEDEPIALSLDELNKIDISESGDTAAEAPIPEVQPLAGIPTQNIDLEELNEVQKDISPAADIGDLKSHIIEEKMDSLSSETKDELKSVLFYLDTLLENLPEDKIQQFAKSEYYDLYVKILDKLGI